MDVMETIAPRSDQQNFDDYQAGPRTVTVADVKLPGGDQPMHLHLVEFPGRPYKPAKSMRRVLVNVWGPDTATWVGRKLTLYGDPDVKFGGQVVGGIRISHMSHIEKPVTVSLTVTRGKRAPFTVQPLAVPDSGVVGAALDDIERAESMPALKAAWDLAGKRGVQGHPDVVAAKETMKEKLS